MFPRVGYLVLACYLLKLFLLSEDDNTERDFKMLFVKLLTGSLKQTLSTSTAPVRSISHELAHSYFNQFSSYCEMISEAKSLARRSILIDNCGTSHVDLSSFENVERVYLIEKESRRGSTNLSLIEFKSENDAAHVVRQARHNEGLLPVPLNILRYSSNFETSHTMTTNTTTTTKAKQAELPFRVDKVKLSYKRELSTKFNSYVDLLSRNSMSIVDFKLRLITLVNLERVLCSGLFQEYELMPFGSSVIQFGCDMGDLDLVVTRKENHDQFIANLLVEPKQFNKLEPTSHSKLVHLDKSLFSEARDQSGVRGTMRWFDHVLREYVPLTDGYNVLFVRYAKVPIIKFTSLVTTVDCDLSFNFGLDYREQDVMTTNYSGIIMSQILYSVCRNNNLFTAAATYLRIFGKLTSVTSKEINIGMTNFQFLSLILFFLQQVTIKSEVDSFSTPQPIETLEDISKMDKYKIDYCRHRKDKPIFPPFKDLLNIKQSTLLRQQPQLLFSNEQLNKLLPELINDFFKFYSNLNFINGALNLYEGKLEKKLDNSNIYVLNPLNRTQNICHNVNRHGLENFIHHVKKAATSVESGQETPLSVIRGLLEKHQQQIRKSATDSYDLRSQNRLSAITGEIAQDIFR